MEKLVNGQVLKLSTNALLYEHQSGFLPKHSTVTQLCYLSNQWQMALEKGEEIHAVFLDLSKAYDCVSITGLLYKLSSLGFTDSTMQWFTSFLTNREQQVRVDGCLSLPQAPKSGIRKGRSCAQFFSWCISTICPDLYQVSARYSRMTPLCSRRVVTHS